MNLTEETNSGNGLLYVGFNQDQGCFACGTTTGFRIFCSDPLKQRARHDFEPRGPSDISGGLTYVEMLFRCNFMALVGNAKTPLNLAYHVIIWDDLKKIHVKLLHFSKPVRAVKLRRDYIVVVLDTMVKVYTFTSSPEFKHVWETCDNSRGLCVLCPNSNCPLLAFPSPKIGQVEVKYLGVLGSGEEGQTIAAHQAPLACLALNASGTRLATASTKGTLIRVFDPASGQMIAELRRGANQATIYCINFNKTSKWLCVTSDHGTVHVFSLEDSKLNRQSSLATVNFLPKYFSSNWSFCKFTIPNGPPCICAFGSERCSIIVICIDGSYYKYKINEKGESTREEYSQFLDITSDR